MAHEGIVYIGGALFFGDENRTGAIFKAIPTNPNDLTAGGTLYYMVGTGIDASGWKLVATPDNAVAEAINGGAILFDRPEDVDGRNGRVYFTVTEPQGDSDTRKGNYNGTAAGGVSALNQVVNRGGIYSFSATGVPELSTQSGPTPAYTKLTPMIEVQDPIYATQAAAQAQQGLQFPDNIAFDGRGHLWVHEDIPDTAAGAAFPASGVDVSKQLRNQQDELYVYELNATGDAIIDAGTVSKGVKASDMRSSDPTHPCENEYTGGVFAADGLSLCINQQHWQNPTFCGTILSPLGNQVPEAPLVMLLSASALVVAGGGALFMKRRHRMSVI
jgi:secreted PhoX family phosphatase